MKSLAFILALASLSTAHAGSCESQALMTAKAIRTIESGTARKVQLTEKSDAFDGVYEVYEDERGTTLTMKNLSDGACELDSYVRSN
jgi:hypothetical protein